MALAPFSSATAEPRIDLDAIDHRDGALERVEAERLARWAPDTFLESLVVLSNGDLLIPDAIGHDILRATPSGDVSVFFSGDISPMGLAISIDNTVIATGRDGQDQWNIFVFAPTGELRTSIPVADAEGLNGATFLTPTVVLANDATIGRIFRIDLETNSVTTWHEHALYQRDPEQSELIPGINGIKISKGAAYISNTSQMTILRTPLEGPDFAAGEPEILHRDLIIDDFSIAADGTIYGTTHIYNTVVRIEPDGGLTRIATTEDGVEGSTATAFGRSANDAAHLYVVGDGGFYLDPENANEAFLVRLDVNDPGLSIAASFDHIPYPGKIETPPAALVTCSTAPGKNAARKRAAPQYTRFLELNAPRIMMAGQVTTEVGAPPSARQYVFRGMSVGEAETLMRASPYFVAGVYARCEGTVFTPMAGDLLGGVAWGDSVSQSD
ncbi:hypothetical protein [Eilatimonas milleporae]|uniref:Uncharacterized protein n=1 Tax=Eilatimonas milleporae TaxID=911205 RepID=A0A3M0C5A8_9PROT|nr:hypothetical protein [Eilatimonas milleporae]RMB02006.1 hypothetical protein BXY39_3516 [Eilatimonas milleporae]